MSELQVKRLIEEVFDTSKEPWQRKLCGRFKCQELVCALEEYTGHDGFGDKERCCIPDECIPNVRQVYENILET